MRSNVASQDGVTARLLSLVLLLAACPGDVPARADLAGDGAAIAFPGAAPDTRPAAERPEGSASAPTPAAPAPCRALVAIDEHASALAAFATANAGYVTVYKLSVPVEAGDRLRARAQVEITNDYSEPVRANVRLLADGKPVGSSSSQNCVSQGSHHMPLWADAIVSAASAGTIQVEAQLAASRSDASPSVKIEDGYGHLVVERYRLYPSRAAAAAAGAALLVEHAADRHEAVGSFGAVAFQPTVVYTLSLSPTAGDLVRLLGQSTSGWRGGADQHSLGIQLAGQRLGPWSTENTPWATQTVPLFGDAVHRPATASAQSYTLTMHGVLTDVAPNTCCSVVPGGGHLYALRFSPAASAPASARELHDAVDSAGPAATGAMVANTGWKVVHSHALGLEAGDALRLTGYLELAYPSAFSLGIACVAKLELLGPGGEPVAASAPAAKYVTQLLEVLPLRTELVTGVVAAGPHTARLSVSCAREAASPTLTLVGGRTRILVDQFRAAR
jgi:hypothetical protein